MKFKLILLSILLPFFLFSQKVEITSDTMKAEDLQKKVNFLGNAKIKQGNSWLYANRVIVYFDEHNQTNKYEAIGNVTFQFKEKPNAYKGAANKVIYFPLKSKYILIGKVKMNDVINKRQVLGEKVLLNMLSGSIDIKSNGNKPVKFIFDVKNK